MTTDGDFLTLAQGVSALVVGLESYAFTGSDTRLPGAATSAARFASWLVERKGCLPERITLMTTGAQAADEIANSPYCAKIRCLDHARSDEDFTEWITHYGPAKDDRLFLLFWVGHGFAYPDDEHERLALLGSDANRDVLRHVELKNLLHAASGIASKANVVAFVNACRAPVPSGWEQMLASGFRDLLTPERKEASRTGKRFVVYAAAHGQTTKMAGNENETFADYLLDRLEALDPGHEPADIFGDDLEAFVKNLSWRQDGPHWTTYGYSDRHGEHLLPPPPNDQELTSDEWRNLVQVAAAVDAANDTSMTWKVRWGAYYHAVDLNGREDRPRRLRSITDLVLALRSWRPQGGQAPPLVIACDYVANLPTEACQPELARWCGRWADVRGGDGIGRLKLARQKRPGSLSDRPYLSITVDDYFASSPGRYQVKPVLAVIGEPCSLPTRGPVAESQIPAQIRAVINEAVKDGTLPVLDDLLVEVVLPHRLVRRGWRPEYMRPEPYLGIEYAVVIRDLDVVRGVGKNGAVARTRAWEKFRIMGTYVPDEDSGWSKPIRWFTCEEAGEPTSDEILKTVRDHDKFCIGLGRNKSQASSRGRSNGSPRGFVDSIEHGAAIVISMHHVKGCNNCLRVSSDTTGDNGWACEVLQEKRRVIDKVKESSNGLLDLPYILRDIRTSLSVKSQLNLGVYMEDPSRLWWDRLRLESQYRPDDGRRTSEKGQ